VEHPKIKEKLETYKKTIERMEITIDQEFDRSRPSK
jgi:hypothetical protein